MPISASLINYYDQAQEYLEVVAAFLEFNEPDELEKEELTKNRKQISATVAEIDKWLQPVQAVEKLPHEAQLAALLPLYPQLRSRSPNISILPTQQQRDRFSQAFQTVSNKIDQLVAAENKRVESLSTEQACNTYKIEIQGIIDQITQIADLPTHLIESLQNALCTSNIRLTDIRQEAEEGQKQVEDTQIMQNIRNSATKIKTIYLSQAALQELENLQSRFNYPDKFQHEVAEIVQSIKNKITSDRSSLVNLRTQLQSVNNLTELDVINTEYAKLDVVFQDSADYQDYQELQPQIQSLKHDLEQIQSLEIRYQQSDSIASYNHILAIIASRELNIYNADRFQGRIYQLEVNFRNKIQEYEQKESQILQQKQELSFNQHPPQPLALDATPQQALAWATKDYLPFRRWEVIKQPCSASRISDSLADSFVEWMLQHYPQMQVESVENSYLNYSVASRVQNLCQESPIFWVVVDGLGWLDHLELLSLLTNNYKLAVETAIEPRFSILPTKTEYAKWSLYAQLFPNDSAWVADAGKLTFRFACAEIQSTALTPDSKIIINQIYSSGFDIDEFLGSNNL
ncbi:hypothetical protein [Nostoc sp.]|uniref:hypothetical protein n=1 Tax=Nostoc sp. TaxID=1180 RepID=UPI002FF967E1